MHGGVDLLAQDDPAGIIRIDEIELEAAALQDIGDEIAGLVGIRGDADHADGAAACQGLFQVPIFSKDGHNKYMGILGINS